jgi:hypothetical protein
MTRGASPWSDPAVEAGFAAAYASLPPAQDPILPAPHDDDGPAEAPADAALRPLTRTGRRARAPQPGRLSPGRAVAGAAVSVSGVLLGIGTLLWVTEDPSRGPGPVVQEPSAAAALDRAGVPATSPPEMTAAPAESPPPPPPSANPAPAPSPPAAAPRPPVVPVTVLNNSRRTGLADRAAARFRAAGWPVAKTGNFRGRIPVTTVYYEPGQQAAAQEFARRFDGIARVRPRFATLPARGLVLVVTREYSA